MDVDELTQRIVAFRKERDWAQFHTPRQLAAGLSIEAGELQELLLWKFDREVEEFLETEKGKRRFAYELAHVLISALLCCHEADIHPGQAIRAKLEENARKYPVDKAKGEPTNTRAFPTKRRPQNG